MPEFEIIKDQNDTIAVFDLGDSDIGLCWLSPGYTRRMEIWHDHAHDGCGVNNFVIDALGRELDLEFCRSRDLVDSENSLIDQSAI